MASKLSKADLAVDKSTVKPIVLKSIVMCINLSSPLPIQFLNPFQTERLLYGGHLYK